MSSAAETRSLDMTRHVVPAGVMVAAIVLALMAWFHLEDQIDERITERLKPVLTQIDRLDADRDQDMTEIKQTLGEMRRELQQVRESLARLEGVR